MPRQPMHLFGEGTEVVRVYLAATLEEAQQAERALDAAGVTYAVEAETFVARTILGSGAPRQGAGVWLLEADLDAACAALTRAGLVRGLVDRG
jgi:2-methylcitrate dehydratase PrpD